MKKVTRKSRIDDLMIDVIEYAFTEWLVRRNLYSAFKANYSTRPLSRDGFRDRLRAHIRRSFNNPVFGPKNLVSSAFVFLFTPEGVAFWTAQAAAWERFYSKFQTKR